MDQHLLPAGVHRLFKAIMQIIQECINRKKSALSMEFHSADIR
jgi:hypothetical protein